ncbi:MAG TPA: adenylyl-sulfate kinase [Candidatus Peribacteraceae bacterium]|nr:adenylyl-sulfate kinase [Candidatus Peribacteraceae bacterium]
MTTRRLPILWLTGNTGAGKTTLATAAESYFNEHQPVSCDCARRVVVLDGDDMRATISTEETLSASDRRKHNLRVARLAAHLQQRGFLVIVAVIAPFQSVRDEIQPICNPRWIYVKRSGLGAADRPYESPLDPDLIIDNDALDISNAASRFLTYIETIVAQSVIKNAAAGAASMNRL